jgi:hypothetical protein
MSSIGSRMLTLRAWSGLAAAFMPTWENSFSGPTGQTPQSLCTRLKVTSYATYQRGLKMKQYEILEIAPNNAIERIGPFESFEEAMQKLMRFKYEDIQPVTCEYLLREVVDK